MNKISVFLYGLVCYAIFFATFLYMIGFVGNVFVPKSIDSGEAGPLGIAIAINLGLLIVFGLQHSVMARPWFKGNITRYIPEPAERSTYVLLSSVAFVLLFWLWQPMGGIVWTIQNDTAAAVAWAAFGSGWLIILASSFFINHFDLFGLRQVWLHLIGKEYTHLKFGMPGPYKYIRHPLYVGWMTAFWCTPTMSFGHLAFAGSMTAYIFIAIVFEERDLAQALGDIYRRYRSETPMFLPLPKRKAG